MQLNSPYIFCLYLLVKNIIQIMALCKTVCDIDWKHFDCLSFVLGCLGHCFLNVKVGSAKQFVHISYNPLHIH